MESDPDPESRAGPEITPEVDPSLSSAAINAEAVSLPVVVAQAARLEYRAEPVRALRVASPDIREMYGAMDRGDGGYTPSTVSRNPGSRCKSRRC